VASGTRSTPFGGEDRGYGVTVAGGPTGPTSTWTSPIGLPDHTGESCLLADGRHHAKKLQGIDRGKSSDLPQRCVQDRSGKGCPCEHFPLLKHIRVDMFWDGTGVHTGAKASDIHPLARTKHADYRLVRGLHSAIRHS
jgi:hypothetical protein